MDDLQLVEDFVKNGSQAAFNEIVERHSQMVHSVCSRILNGQTQEAEDAAQGVFLILLKKAPRLNKKIALGGWLYKTAVLVARQQRRKHKVWKKREEEATQMMADLNYYNSADLRHWTEIRPHIDEAISSLPNRMSKVVVLRLMDNQPWAEVSRICNCSQDAARKRCNKALEKLCVFLKNKRGITLSSTILASVVVANSLEAGTGFSASSMVSAIASLNGSSIGASSFTSVQIAKEYLKMLFLKKVSIVSIAVLSTFTTGAAIYAAKAAGEDLNKSKPKVIKVLASSKVENVKKSDHKKQPTYIAKKIRNISKMETELERLKREILEIADSNPQEALRRASESPKRGKMNYILSREVYYRVFEKNPEEGCNFAKSDSYALSNCLNKWFDKNPGDAWNWVNENKNYNYYSFKPMLKHKSIEELAEFIRTTQKPEVGLITLANEIQTTNLPEAFSLLEEGLNKLKLVKRICSMKVYNLISQLKTNPAMIDYINTIPADIRARSWRNPEMSLKTYLISRMCLTGQFCVKKEVEEITALLNKVEISAEDKNMIVRKMNKQRANIHFNNADGLPKLDIHF
jgi:RNA polymerase sigma factor (sigma-70 family)